MRAKPKNIEENISPSPHEIIFCLVKHLAPVKKQTNVQQSFSLSLVRCRPSRDHLATDSVRANLSLLSARVSPVDRFAFSPVLIVAVVRQVDKVASQTLQLPLSIETLSQNKGRS